MMLRIKSTPEIFSGEIKRSYIILLNIKIFKKIIVFKIIIPIFVVRDFSKFYSLTEKAYH